MCGEVVCGTHTNAIPDDMLCMYHIYANPQSRHNVYHICREMCCDVFSLLHVPISVEYYCAWLEWRSHCSGCTHTCTVVTKLHQFWCMRSSLPIFNSESSLIIIMLLLPQRNHYDYVLLVGGFHGEGAKMMRLQELPHHHKASSKWTSHIPVGSLDDYTPGR